MLDGQPYPLTIVSDRYTGSYSGAPFTAWNLYPDEVPDDINSDDISCMDFWRANAVNKKYVVGKGDTPNEAMQDLTRRMS